MRDKQTAKMGRPKHRPAETMGPSRLLRKGHEGESNSGWH